MVLYMKKMFLPITNFDDNEDHYGVQTYKPAQDSLTHGSAMFKNSPFIAKMGESGQKTDQGSGKHKGG